MMINPPACRAMAVSMSMDSFLPRATTSVILPAATGSNRSSHCEHHAPSPSAVDHKCSDLRLGGQDDTTISPTLQLHAIVNDRISAPVSMRNYWRVETVTKSSARHTTDDNGAVPRLEDEIVHEACRDDDLTAQHVREAPAPLVVSDRVPLGDFDAIGQASEHRAAAGAFGENDAAHTRSLTTLADEHIPSNHRAYLGLARRAVWLLQTDSRLWTKAAAAAHELVRQHGWPWWWSSHGWWATTAAGHW